VQTLPGKACATPRLVVHQHGPPAWSPLIPRASGCCNPANMHPPLPPCRLTALAITAGGRLLCCRQKLPCAPCPPRQPGAHSSSSHAKPVRHHPSHSLPRCTALCAPVLLQARAAPRPSSTAASRPGTACAAAQRQGPTRPPSAARLMGSGSSARPW